MQEWAPSSSGRDAVIRDFETFCHMNHYTNWVEAIPLWVGQMRRYLSPGTVETYVHHLIGKRNMGYYMFRLQRAVQHEHADPDTKHAVDVDRAQLIRAMKAQTCPRQKSILYLMLCQVGRHRDIRRLRTRQIWWRAKKGRRESGLAVEWRIRKNAHSRGDRIVIVVPARLIPPMPDDVADFLRYQLPNEKIFKEITLKSTLSAIKKSLPRIGATTYTFRRSYEQNVDDKAKNLEEALALSGHTSYSTRRAYYVIA
jgi:hypothetical protein